MNIFQNIQWSLIIKKKNLVSGYDKNNRILLSICSTLKSIFSEIVPREEKNIRCPKSNKDMYIYWVIFLFSLI